MSLIIWAASHEGLLLASDRGEQPRIFLRGKMLLAVAGDPNYAAQLAEYLEKHEVDLASALHVEALRTVVCDKLPADSQATVAFGQHNHGLSGIVLMRLSGKRCEALETREYTDASETEFIPMGEDAPYFLSKVAQHPNYLKTLRQKKIKFVKDLTLETARKIAREMIRDTSLAANRKAPEVDAYHL
mgnify:CR=1 FL=1